MQREDKASLPHRNVVKRNEFAEDREYGSLFNFLFLLLYLPTGLALAKGVECDTKDSR